MKRTFSRKNFILQIRPVNDGNPSHARETSVFDTKQALLADFSQGLKRAMAYGETEDIDFVIHVNI